MGKSAGRRSITVHLDADTAAFLEMAKADDSPDSISNFINSLLRQERFRQGYPAPLSMPSDIPVKDRRVVSLPSPWSQS